MQTITQEGLIEKLRERSARGAFPVTIVASVDARLVKKNREDGSACPFVGVRKVSRVNGMLNWIYGNAVNRQHIREGNAPDFTPEPRKWGVRIDHTPFVTYGEKLYLELKVERSLGHEYQDAEGRIIPPEALRGWLPKTSSNAEHQGVEREIVLRDYDVQNVLAITIDGEDYLIVRRG